MYFLLQLWYFFGRNIPSITGKLTSSTVFRRCL